MKHHLFFSKSACVLACAILLEGCSLTPSSPASTQEVPSLSGSGKAAEKTPAMIPDEPSVPASEEIREEPETASESETVSDNSFFGYILSEEEKNDPHVICKETAEEGKAVLLFTGDVALDDNWSNMAALRSRANGIYDTLSPELMNELNNADICMVNNEFPYSDRGTPTPDKQFTFRADPSRVEILQQMGVDIVSLANNHAYDFGPDALMDTFRTLESAQIPYVGAGRNLSEAMEPTYFIAGGQKIAYVSATQIERYESPDTKEATEDSPGVLRTLNPDKFLTVIEEAEENSSFVIVYVHWGSENTYEVEASQRDLAAAYIEAGADLIIGDHSHCLQGFEYINGVPVIYSLGNFWFNSKNLDTGMVKASISSGRLESLQFLPCLQHNCRTDLLLPSADGEYERILGVMVSLSKDVSVDENGFVSSGAGSGVAAVTPRPLKKPDPPAVPSENAILPTISDNAAMPDGMPLIPDNPDITQ